MRHGIGLACLALLLAATTAHADILPTPDRGPPTGNAGGLDFAVQSVEVEMHGYSKMLQVVVLDGCTDGQPNCALARSRNLIGMEVLTVNGRGLQPQNGMVQQIIDAFGNKTAAPTVTLELVSRESKGEPIKVSFARR